MPTDRAAPPPTTPWEARFGRLILQDGIAAIPLALFLYQARLGLSAQQVWFVSAILARRWSADLPYPSLAGLAAATGVSVRTLQYLRASLCGRQYLAVYEGYDGTGRRTANSYDFAGLFAALEAVIAADGDAAGDLEAPELPPAPLTEPETGRSFLARYGRVIARKGIAAVPQALFSQQAALGLSPQQVWFVAYILGHRWTTALPHPSLRRMAQRTGYSERQIHNVKEELVAQGYLRLVHRQGAGGGQDTNGYDFSALLAALQAHLSPLPVPPDATAPPDPLRDPAPESALPPRRGRRPPRAPADGAEVRQALAAEARGPVQQASVGVVQQLSEGPVQALSEGRMQAASVGPVQEPAGGASGLRRTPATPFRAGGATEFGGAGASDFRRKESDHVESDHPGDSNRPALPKAERGTQNAERPNAECGTRNAELPKAECGTRNAEWTEPRIPPVQIRQSAVATDLDTRSPVLPRSAFRVPRSEVPTSAYSPYIAGVILDYSREFGDALHGPANVTQALRLWQASGLPETAFVDLLHEARRRVRLHQGKQGAGQIWNKMAYYYRVVAALLAAPPGEDAAPDSGVGGSWTD